MDYIASNLRYVRESKGFSQEYFAEELKWTRSMVASFETGRTEPSVTRLIELSDYMKIPIDTLIRVDLRKARDLSFIDIGNRRILFPISVNADNEEMIEVVPIGASAGYLSGYDDPEYIEALQRFNLPFLPTGTHRAFPIKGDSMLPVKPGSFIVARYVGEVGDIRSGRTYVVLTKRDGLVYKRVYDHIKERGALLLVSDNKRYEPYEVPMEEVLELWEFACCINTQEYSKEELKLESILGLFQELRVELRRLDPSMDLTTDLV